MKPYKEKSWSVFINQSVIESGVKRKISLGSSELGLKKKSEKFDIGLSLDLIFVSNDGLRNKQVGYYTNGGPYRADCFTEYNIEMGEHVTQKTDFLIIMFETNAHFEVSCSQNISMKPGTHIKQGAQVYEYISSYGCGTKSISTLTNTESNYQGLDEITSIKDEDRILLIPNPTIESFFVKHSRIEVYENVDFAIYSLSDAKVQEGIVNSHQQINVSLKEGIYLFTININGSWISSKLVIK